MGLENLFALVNLLALIIGYLVIGYYTLLFLILLGDEVMHHFWAWKRRDPWVKAYLGQKEKR